MRGVAFVRSLLAAVAAAGSMIILMSAVPLMAGDASATQEQAGKPAAPEDDYYTRRAKSVIDAERAALNTPHPLAASYPGKEIVVCEAGCEGRAPQVVFVRPEILLTEAKTEGMMVPTSTSDGRAVPADEIACVAGCYGAASATADYAAPTTEPEAVVAPDDVSVEEWTPPLRPRITIDEKLSPVR